MIFNNFEREDESVEKINSAKELLRLGVDEEVIARGVGLSIDIVKSLSSKLKI